MENVRQMKPGQLARLCPARPGRCPGGGLPGSVVATVLLSGIGQELRAAR
ncbi:hypothetical protein ABZ341_31595 [Streptomyces sp. NPDC006173]